MALWTPADITTELWLDASDTATITKSGDDVTQWNDKSGNGYNYTQSAGSSAPHSGTRTLDSKNVVDFDGSAQYMNISSGGFQPGANNSIAVAVVVQDSASLTTERIWTARVGGSTRFGIYNITTPFTTPHGVLYAHCATYTPVNDTWASGTKIIAGYKDSTTLGVGYDGDLTPATNSGGGTVGTLTTWDLGGIASEGYFDGAIAEIVYVDTTDSGSTLTDLRQTIEGYLAWKWGLEANLPTGHPYESAAPTTGIDLDMDTININRALPDPTLLLSIELNMDTININRALPDPTATVVPNSVELDMTTINIDRALPDPDVSLSLELDMDTININRALPDPSVSIGINLDMSTLNINRAIPDPTILLSIEINPNEININRALPDPDVTILGGAIDLSMTTININRALPDVDLDIPIVLDMDVININRALPGPTLSLNIRCDMDTLNIDRTLPDTTVLLSIELDMDTINISRSVLNPSVTIGAEVPTGVVNTYKFEFFALNYININIPSKEQYPRVIEFKKNTSEILPITADFFGLLAGIEEIAAIDTKAYLVDSDVTAQIIDSSSFGTYDVDLVVKSGSNGNTYKLTIKITTDDSNIYEEDILMYVRDRVDHEEFTKQPSEQFGVALNLINKLQASETIDTVEFSVLDSSLQTVTLDLIEKYEIDDNLVKFLLKEGIDNETYNININMTTNLGHIYNKNLTLKVVDT